MFGRISIARKNLFHEKGRLIISVIGVTFAVFLILILLALYRGWSETLSEYIYTVDAEIWVMQKGSIDMSHSVSLLPNATRDQLLAVSGVEEVDVLVSNRIALDINGEDVTTRIIGFDIRSNIGGPVHLESGTSVQKRGEIVVNDLLKKDHNVDLNDMLTISDNNFRVVGTTAGGPLFQQSYIAMEDARDIFHFTDTSNFFLVNIDENARAEDVIQRIEEDNPGVDAQTEEEFATNNEKEIMDKFLPIILVLVFIGFLVGVVIISLTIYTATIEKSREYGVLKAVGATNVYLYNVVLTQSGIAGTLGFILATILTIAGSDVIQNIEPLFVTLVKWEDIAIVAGMTIAMIIVASYIPMRRIMRIDPALVFKA